jgi:hypothetical protein
MSVAEKMEQWAAANGVGELQAATLDAHSRLNNVSIGTQVKAGRCRVVSTVYGKKTTSVTPLSDWLVIADAVSFLKSLNPSPKQRESEGVVARQDGSRIRSRLQTDGVE